MNDALLCSFFWLCSVFVIQTYFIDGVVLARSQTSSWVWLGEAAWKALYSQAVIGRNDAWIARWYTLICLALKCLLSLIQVWVTTTETIEKKQCHESSVGDDIGQKYGDSSDLFSSWRKALLQLSEMMTRLIVENRNILISSRRIKLKRRIDWKGLQFEGKSEIEVRSVVL